MPKYDTPIFTINGSAWSKKLPIKCVPKKNIKALMMILIVNEVKQVFFTASRILDTLPAP